MALADLAGNRVVSIGRNTAVNENPPDPCADLRAEFLVVVAEREVFRAQVDVLTAVRDAVVAERDVIAGERDALRVERDALAAEVKAQEGWVQKAREFLDRVMG